MKGFLAGVVLLPLIVVTVLGARPGGLRVQLRLAVRRLRIALLLAGAYVIGSGAIRVLLGPTQTAEWAIVGLAGALAIVYLVLAQDPRPRVPPS